MKKAPSFTGKAVVRGEVVDFSLAQYLGERELLLFFYPQDFTYVCPTELLSLQEALSRFEERGVAVVAASTDSAEVHAAWLRTPVEEGGIQGVTFPLVADPDKTLAANFGVLGGAWASQEGKLSFLGTPFPHRATFLIDKEGYIRAQQIYGDLMGRGVQELLRVIDMWHYTQEHGQVCPANWQRGEPALSPTPQGVAHYLEERYGRQRGCVNKKCRCNPANASSC